MPISDEKLGDFLGRVAARQPVPGGGAVAALLAAQGAALLGMAARYTEGDAAAARGETLRHIVTETDELRGIALRLADADEDAFAAVAAAYGLPGGTPGEQAARAAAISRALAGAAWPPAQVIGVAGVIVAIAEALAALGARTVIADIAAAAEAARAAAATARVAIEVGLADITDEQASLEIIAQAHKAGEVITRAERVTAAVREKIRG